MSKPEIISRIDPEETARLRIEFSRNVEKFTFPLIWDYVHAPREGYFMQIGLDEARRLAAGEKYEWPRRKPPARLPSIDFCFKPYDMMRYAFTQSVTPQEKLSAKVQVEKELIHTLGVRSMHLKSVKGIDQMADAKNWRGHQLTGKDLAGLRDFGCTPMGDHLDGGSVKCPVLGMSIHWLVKRAVDDSCGLAHPRFGQFFFVINPASAAKLSRSKEFDSWVPPPDEEPSKYHLPKKIGDARIVVETQAVNRPGKSPYAVLDGCAFLIYKQDRYRLEDDQPEEAEYGHPILSTLAYHYSDEMTLARRLEEGMKIFDLCETSASVVAAPITGFYLTECFSPD